VLAALTATAIAGASSSKDGSLSVVAYSTPKTVYGKIIQAWQQTAGGKGVSFTQSYAASTDQARAVAAGLKADLVFLSTGDDVNILVDAGLVDKNWDKQAYKGIEADTVVVFAVRNGNPKHIKSCRTWVSRSGVDAEPVQLRIGQVEYLAAYGAQRHLGKNDAQARAFVQGSLPARRLAGTSGRTRPTPSCPARATSCSPTSEALTRGPAGQISVRDPSPDDADRAADAVLR
jgi:sulfate transport system substrate-binding protein